MTACPQCDQPLKSEPPYAGWCPSCDWNVVRAPSTGKTRFARLQTKLASFMTYGRRRRRVVEIGYPLWLVLTPQERVALLAHEMAHSSNGDGRHGLVVGSALHSLGVLRDVTRFDWQEGDGVSRLVAETFLAVLGLMELLLYRSAQRAEYRADELAARAAGTTATISLLDALITRAESVHDFLDASVVATRTDDLWTAIRSYVESLPESERERLRRAARLEELRVDRTHPPTYLRMSRLAALPYEEGRVRAPGGASGTELASPAARVAEAIREDAQSALYR
ncbi:hypothetical protein E1286_03705 [Nonomuraea terrae]|uniref:Peptidase M48 domain-containing protein n=1 Tax=Nonomuraea terrae TaxID=2530383 RepID=A0A4R4ZC44_9ACTN|nr:M48 family metalloprotease [Nonomuraea terrae]TDD55855.1 hypothetical protein E1286_03705 [Nonomuraea terrae]